MSAPDEPTSGEDLAGDADPRGVNMLFPKAYDRLRELAAQFIRAERSKRLLQATALVHEAFLRLSERDREFADEREFLAIAATQMRHVLVDYARRALTAKRGSGDEPVTLDSQILGGSGHASFDLVDVDDSLKRLMELDARQGHLAELHLFGGLTIDETAMLLGISPRTAFSDWRAARAWLLKELAP